MDAEVNFAPLPASKRSTNPLLLRKQNRSTPPCCCMSKQKRQIALKYDRYKCAKKYKAEREGKNIGIVRDEKKKGLQLRS
ncbi:hypothetical protein C1H71_02580 [Iodobacter fluviatilis]|uniref:Uncharacterized protein n=1 Tax=Iodobacter fluviatilis TaxID=537 RepID=A0A7G3G5J0_9NEIS|nr:hypothetical protein C1H71_02580 [Iodobacter fluviatilis]